MANRLHREQSYRNIQRRLGCFVVLLCLFLPLAACGKKPNHLEPPLGAEDNAYPRTYPDPATDPKP